MDNWVGPLIIRIGAEANGEDHEDVEDVVVAEVETVVEVEEEAGVVLDHTIPLRAIAVGCAATWPATAPNLRSHREVAWLALPEESLLNPCKKAPEAEAEEVDRSDSVASASCTTMRVTNTLSTMQDSCMCHQNLGRLLSMERLRWKWKKEQKTEKDLCQCGCCKYHPVFN